MLISTIIIFSIVRYFTNRERKANEQDLAKRISNLGRLAKIIIIIFLAVVLLNTSIIIAQYGVERID